VWDAVGRVTSSLPFDPIDEAARQWRSRWGDDPVPAMAAVTSVMRVEQILMARLNALLRPFDLNFPRYEALMLLHFSRRGGLPLGKMGDRLQVHRTSVTNIVDGLERTGLVRRTAHAKDRRATVAEITERGREVAEAATAVLHDARFGTAPLADSDLDALTGLLRGLREDEA
jgi:DNA-binding MarR family transcriptional regulator